MITTPLGNIEIYIDNKHVCYNAVMCNNDKMCMSLNGRYKLCIGYSPDGKSHEIVCVIKNYKPSKQDGIECGERLELKSFYYKASKLSIGMEGDSGYLPDGTRISEYDYDNEYVNNGVKYVVFPETKTKVYVFGIAWIDEVNDENDVQTWYGADPILMP